MNTSTTTEKRCTVPGCDGLVRARGLCSRHYQRLQTRGTTERYEHPPLAERFWTKVDRRNDGCWPWLAGTTAAGYGVFKMPDGPARMATHVSWYLKHARWPKGWMLHRCDNPACVNPAHLFEGTHEENMRDMKRKQRGRNGSTVGEKNARAKLTEADVREIRQLHRDGLTQTEIARRFGVGSSHVSSIVRGKRWAHVR